MRQLQDGFSLDEDVLPWYIYVSIIGGAILLMVIITLLLVCCCKRDPLIQEGEMDMEPYQANQENQVNQVNQEHPVNQ